MTLPDDDGITTTRNIFELKTPDPIGHHFQTNDGAQARSDKLDDLPAGRW